MALGYKWPQLAEAVKAAFEKLLCGFLQEQMVTG